MKIFTEFEEIKLSNNEKAIADYIEDKPEVFLRKGIQELSDSLFISIGSISRFAKKMGFNSFRDLKSFVIKENLRNGSYYNLKSSNSTNGVIHNVKVYNRHTIEKTVDALNSKDIKKVVQDIEKSSKIVTYGLGSSSLAANELANNLNINGINSVFATTIHDVILWLKKKIDKKLMVIIFSKSMWSHDNNFLLNLLIKYKINVVLVTENLQYQKKENLNIIHIKTLERLDDKTQISSKISQLFIADVFIQNIKRHSVNNNTDIYKEFHDQWYKK